MNKKQLTRICAVKALYSLAINDEQTSLEELAETTIKEIEGNGKISFNFFKEIIEATQNYQENYNQLIEQQLSEDWKLARLGHLLLAILHAAIYELECHKDTPTKVIINEYVDIAAAFFEEQEVSFVNAILDKLAQQLRT